MFFEIRYYVKVASKCGTDARNPLSSVGLGSRVVVIILQDLLGKTERKKLKKYHLFLIIFLPLQKETGMGEAAKLARRLNWRTLFFRK